MLVYSVAYPSDVNACLRSAAYPSDVSSFPGYHHLVIVCSESIVFPGRFCTCTAFSNADGIVTKDRYIENTSFDVGGFILGGHDVSTGKQ